MNFQSSHKTSHLLVSVNILKQIQSALYFQLQKMYKNQELQRKTLIINF